MDRKNSNGDYDDDVAVFDGTAAFDDTAATTGETGSDLYGLDADELDPEELDPGGLDVPDAWSRSDFTGCTTGEHRGRGELERRLAEEEPDMAME